MFKRSFVQCHFLLYLFLIFSDISSISIIQAHEELTDVANKTIDEATTVDTSNSYDIRILLFRFFHYFDNVTSQLSDQCVSVSRYFRTHRSDEWALKMIDSNAIIESGLSDGNFQFLGSFDECIRLRIPDNVFVANTSNKNEFGLDSKLIDHSIQYCTVSFPISLIISPKQEKQFPEFIFSMLTPLAGICLPSACNRNNDIHVILDKFNEVNNFSNVTLINCVNSKDLEFGQRFNSYHLAIIGIYLVMLVLILAGTITDYTNKECRKNLLTKFMLCFSLKRNLGFLFHFTSDQPRSSFVVPSERSIVPQSTKCLSQNFENTIPQTSLTSFVISSSRNTNLQSENTLDYSCTGQSKPEISNCGQSCSESTSQPSTEPNQATHKSSRKAPQIQCLHGIRVLSFVFILIYHTFTAAQTPSVNLLQIMNAEREFLKQLITNASLWVDTFLLLSGFLVAHSTLYAGSDRPLSEHLKAHPKRLLHRYLRLTPSIAGVLSLSILIEPLGSGPIWYQYEQSSKQTCHKNWWLLFLYGNNFFNLNQLGQPPSECLVYLWYLAVDMHFFILSPFLIMFLAQPSRRAQFIGIGINLVVIGSSWVVTAVLMALNGLTPTVLVTVYDLAYINKIYKASYCRIGPYCVGILLAYYLWKKQSTVNRKALTVSLLTPEQRIRDGSIKVGLLILSTSVVLMLATTLLTYPWLLGTDYHNAASVAYGTVHRTVWAFAWALFIYGCVRGHLQLVNQVFAINIFQLLSKLTYQSYLLHPLLISAVTSSVRQKIYFSDSNLVLDLFRYFILTMLTSIGTFSFFERPFINIEQTFLK